MSKGRQVTLTCAGCGATFERYRCDMKGRPESAAHYCTQQCWLKHHNASQRTTDSTRRSLTKAARKRGDALRGTGEGKTYIKRNNRHEHRVIAEQKIGRALRPGEVVHHINGNIRDNRPENLHVFASRADHARHHMEERLGRRPAGSDPLAPVSGGPA